MANPSENQRPTDTERLDFIERYLERSGRIERDGTVEIVRAWQVVTASTGDLRETIDLMMQQRERLTNA
jgi:hypothetical protein